MEKAYIVLEDGFSLEAAWHGALKNSSVGEIVFNTSHSGYEEMATDPSYAGQILITTAPMQGNYALVPKRQQSNKVWIKSFLCLEIQNSKRDSSWLDYLLANNVPVVSDLDTRKLVLHLRKTGVQWACVFSEKQYLESKKSLLDFAKKEITNKKILDTVSYTKSASCSKVYHFEKNFSSAESSKDLCKKSLEKKLFNKVAVLDMGCKTNILSILKKTFKEVVVYPYNYDAKEILKDKPDMVLLSNGPGNPEQQLESISIVKTLLTSGVPVFGICMGCQILALALGAKTYKLKFGHRGSNHPIKDILQNTIYMSSQNHGYAIEEKSLPKDIKLSHINLNDKSVAGIFSEKRKVMALQFHPEHSPGPEDAEKLFSWFVNKFIKIEEKSL